MPSNYPSGVSEGSPNAPWNQVRDLEDIEDEITDLEHIHCELQAAQGYIMNFGYSDLLSAEAMAEHDGDSGIDRLEAMIRIVKGRLGELKG